jgi:hypothetical protein
MGQQIMGRPAAAARPHRHNGFWFLIRRVPGEFVAFDRRNPVRISSGIRAVDDPRGARAGEVVTWLDRDLARYWKDKRSGKDADAEARYQQACSTARALGFAYVPATDAAAELPIADMLRRFETVILRGTAANPAEVSAVLGGERPPDVMTATMFEDYEDIVRATVAVKSGRQRKTWRVGNEAAVKVFVDLIGNRPLSSLTRADALKLRSHWQDRIVAGEVEIGTAHKYIGHISGMFRAINENRQLTMPSIFDRVRISGGKDGQRLAFAPDFVQSRILADGMFEDINPEGRDAEAVRRAAG